MDKQAAAKIIKDTFEKPFDRGQFVHFAKNLLNKIDESKAFHARGYIPEIFKDCVKTYERVGTFTDPENDKVDVLIIYLQKETLLEHARTSQRNFVARYLKDRGEKEAALVAFVSPDNEDWRFSLVKMDYTLEETPSGKIKIKTELTPARRWSFLVGKNESSHTAQSQLVDILADDQNDPTLPTFENAFNIEVATREFFKRYRDLFHKVKEELDNLVVKDKTISQEFDDKGIDTVNFAKKLLGQIVFLYFLQKKGWLGVPGNKNWDQGDRKFLRNLFEKCRREKQNFFNDYLEFLFYDALNTQDRGGIDPSYYHRFDCRIPFLNGGLFNSDYDWVKTDIVIPNDIFSNRKTASDEGSGILDIFDLYNFTVKEDEPLEKEVAVDPEMLGKVFENLLEVKDRKSKGTYYTPREIVHYMCQESLINYLDTGLNTGDVPLVHTPPPQGKLIGKPDPQQAALKTTQYSVLIPREDIEDFVRKGESTIEHDNRVETHGKETERYSYKLPESIRRNAKLVDDKLDSIRVCDPAIGSGAFPVSLMTEIVRARSTLTTYLPDKQGRTNYHFKRHAIQNCLYGVDIDPGAVEIAKLRLWLSLVVDEEDIKQIQPLPNLDYKIVCGNSLLGFPFKSSRLTAIERMKQQFFDEKDPDKKTILRSQVDQQLHEAFAASKKSLGYEVNFDFEIYFSEVFHEKGGFDVVIANPPYVSVKAITSNDKEILSSLFDSGEGRFNLFALFMERGHRMLKDCGILTFILPEGIYSSIEYRHIRKYILENAVILLVNLFSDRVFESAVDTSIISIMKECRSENKFTVLRDLSETIIQLEQSLFKALPYFLFPVNLTPQSFPVALKLLHESFDHVSNILEIQQGIIYSGQPKNKVFSNSPISNRHKPVLDGRDVLKWKVNWSEKKENKYIYYTNRLHRPREERLFLANEKILLPRKSTSISCAYDTEKYYALNTSYLCLLNDAHYSLKYVLACLNSKLINYFYSQLFFGWQITIPALNILPIKRVSMTQQQPFIDLVDQILATTKYADYLSNPTKQAKVKELERQIDQMVYELYGLTSEERVVVKGSSGK